MFGASSLPKFGDFDNNDVYKRCHGAAVQGDTRNFVIEFDNTKAYAAYDLDDASIEQLLQLEVSDPGYDVRDIRKDDGVIHWFVMFEG